MVATIKSQLVAPAAPSEHSILTPAQILCFDIETMDASEELIKREIAAWEPPSNVKDPEKIEERRKEAAAKIREKSALLDGAPIACISARTERVGRVFNGINKKKYEVNHSTVVSSGNEVTMLEEFRAWLNSTATPTTTLIGFNIKGFDLRRLRSAYVRHRMKLPEVFAPRLLDEERQPLVDVMQLYLRWFGPDQRRDYISLEEVCIAVGIDNHKAMVSGAEIPGLIRDGKVKEVLTYCAVDTLATLQAYLLMTSSASDMT